VVEEERARDLNAERLAERPSDLAGAQRVDTGFHQRGVERDSRSENRGRARADDVDHRLAIEAGRRRDGPGRRDFPAQHRRDAANRRVVEEERARDLNAERLAERPSDLAGAQRVDTGFHQRGVERDVISRVRYNATDEQQRQIGERYPSFCTKTHCGMARRRRSVAFLYLQKWRGQTRIPQGDALDQISHPIFMVDFCGAQYCPDRTNVVMAKQITESRTGSAKQCLRLNK